MKVLIISDIHGSLYYAKMIPKLLNNENANKIILLGDLYYHGPRNPLSKEYNPMEVSKILNDLKEKLEVIKGNCDAEVDEMISNFDFKEHIVHKIGNKKIYFTHGHKNNIDKLPNEDFDIMIYGHFHTGYIKEKEGKIFANPGSISLPKNNTKHSYIVLDENTMILKDIDGVILEEKKLI